MLIKEKVSRKQQILNKATQLFDDRGYVGSSMRDLAQDLGIEAASLYSHIKSKEEILQNICFRMADEFMKATREVDKKELSCKEQLEAFVQAHIGVITRDTAASSVFFNEWKHLSEPFYSEFLELRNQYEGRFQNIIKKGIKNGEFIDMDTKMATLTLLSSLNWVFRWYNPKGRLTIEELGKELAERMIYGIKK
jgi:AcrR family transcriptional regulator